MTDPAELRLRKATLNAAELRYRTAARRTEHLRERRNAAVREALAEGWTHAQIAEATGLTRGRIGQIAPTRDAVSRRIETESPREAAPQARGTKPGSSETQ